MSPFVLKSVFECFVNFRPKNRFYLYLNDIPDDSPAFFYAASGIPGEGEA